MANQDLKENVLTNLRSVTQSCKGGVPFDRLQRDYRDLLGSSIPFREMGYESLEAFIRDIPHVISLKRNNEGKLMAMGVADASTAHIVSLVSRQKSESKKKPFRKPPAHVGMRRTLSTRYTFREGPRGAHSRYSSSDYSSRSYPRAKTPPLYKSPRTKPSKPPPSRSPPPLRSPHVPRRSPPPPHVPRSPPRSPPPSQQQPKPRVSPEQVPSRRYEVAPRFLKLKEQRETKTESISSPELMSPTTPTSSNRFLSSVSLNNTEVIPPPRASFSVKPAEIKPRIQYDVLESAKTAKEYVEIYAKMKGLTPVYRTVLFGQKAKSKGYVSTLKLDDKSYQSYPEMKPSEELAEEEAASKAMAAIKEQRGKYKSKARVEDKSNTRSEYANNNRSFRRVSILPNENLKIVIKC